MNKISFEETQAKLAEKLAAKKVQMETAEKAFEQAGIETETPVAISEKMESGSQTGNDDAKKSREFIEKRAEIIEKYKRQGIDFSKSPVVLSEDVLGSGNKLVLTHCKDRREGVRKYRLQEMYEETLSGEFGKSCIFKPTDIEDNAGKIREYIKSLEGVYTNCDSVIKILTDIEINRLMGISRTDGTGVLDCATIFQELADYLLANIDKHWVLAYEGQEKAIIGIVGSGDTTCYGNFCKAVQEIAPENGSNAPKMFKDWLVQNNKLLTDTGHGRPDCQYTLRNEAKKSVTGLRGDKCYAFIFDEDITKNIIEAKKAELAKKDGSEN